jgi:hypothetical protein
MGAVPQQKVRIGWSSSFAYGIGLITSDGNLNSDGRHLSFKSAEEELIQKFKTSFNLNNKITKSARGGEKEKRYLNIYFGDVVFYKFLNRIGVTKAKSKTIKAVEVPDLYFPDFLRGLFDGDGTFYTSWDKRWPNSFIFQIAFASASLDFIEWIKSKLTCLYGVKGVICKGDGVFNLSYVKGDTKKLYTVMYHRADLLYLNRKYNKIRGAFQKDDALKLTHTRNRKLRWGSSVVELSPEERRVAGSIPAPSI